MTRSSPSTFSTISKQLSNVVLLLVVVFVLIGFWATQAIEKQQDTIASWLSDSLAYPVEMGAVQIDWQDFSPKIEIQSVRILSQNKKQELLSLETLYLNPDFITSLWDQVLHIDDISLTGLHMTVIRRGNGQLSLQGINNGGDSTPIFAGLLVRSRALDSFQLNNIIIDYIDQQQMVLSGRYRLAEGLIEHSDDKWHAKGHFDVPPDLGEAVSIDVDWQGKELDSLSWQWQVKTEGFLAEPFKPYLRWQDVQLSKALIDTVVSGKGQADKLNSLNFDLQLNDALLMATEPTVKLEPVALKQLTGQATWNRKQNKAWSLSVDRFNLQLNDSVWPEATLSALGDEQGGLTVKSGFIRVEDVGLLASLTGNWPELLQQIKPAGDLRDIEFVLDGEKELTYLSMYLEQVAALPWEGYPGVNGFTGTVRWQSDSLQVAFNSQKISIFAEQWFDDALHFDSLQGQLSLSKSEDGWQATAEKLSVWNDDLTLQLDGKLQKDNDQLISDLHATVEQLDLTQWRNYVPAVFLADDFGIWSKDAFQAGEIEQGQVNLVGDLTYFPFDGEHGEKQGQFDLQAQLIGVDLKYADSWPKLEHVDALLTGKGSDLFIRSQKGMIASFDIANVETKIERYVLDQPMLYLQAGLNGTTQDALTVLQITPLKTRFGRVVSQLTGQGKSDINLDLTVPLIHPNDTEVVGDVSFIDSTLFKTDTTKLAISKLNGIIDFSHESISAKNISAIALGQPASIDIIPGNTETVIRSRGQLSEQSLAVLAGQSLNGVVSGRTPYVLDVAISEQGVGDFYADISLQSELQGLALDLPEPLNKTKQQALALNVNWNQLQRGDYFQLSLGDTLQLELTSQTSKVMKLSLNELNWDDWLSWSTANFSSESNFFLANDEVLIETPSAFIFGQRFDQLTLSAQRQKTAWQATINSQQTSGNMYLPDDLSSGIPVKLVLDNLAVQLVEQDGNSLAEQQVDLWPGVDLSIANLAINDMALGQLTLQSTRTADSWQIDKGQLQSNLFELAVTEAIWQHSDSLNQTKLKLTARSGDLAALLANFGYQQAIEADDVEVGATLRWPSDPLSVSKAELAGRLSFELGKGKLNDVEAGAAGRVFGLLSVSAIPRRLTLDFNDLFRKGFYFNSIEGSFDIRQGQAVTDNLLLKSETANIAITGPVDIVSQRYDQQVKVTPNVSSTLPLAGAVAGGPVGLGVGAAILLVDKLAGQLFDKEIVNLISYSYNLTGPWQEPELSIIKPQIAE